VSRQYAQVVGTPAEVPYWSFGFHQCRFGYKGMPIHAPSKRSANSPDVPS
jgi:hypothetical protein